MPSIATKFDKKGDKSNFLCIPIHPSENSIWNKTSSFDIRGYCKCPWSDLKVFEMLIYSLMVFNSNVTLFSPMLSKNEGLGFEHPLYLRSI